MTEGEKMYCKACNNEGWILTGVEHYGVQERVACDCPIGSIAWSSEMIWRQMCNMHQETESKLKMALEENKQLRVELEEEGRSYGALEFANIDNLLELEQVQKQLQEAREQVEHWKREYEKGIKLDRISYQKWHDTMISEDPEFKHVPYDQKLQWYDQQNKGL